MHTVLYILQGMNKVCKYILNSKKTSKTAMTFKLQSKKALKMFCSGIPLCQTIFPFMETASGLESLVILMVASSSSCDINCTDWEPTFISLT